MIKISIQFIREETSRICCIIYNYHDPNMIKYVSITLVHLIFYEYRNVESSYSRTPNPLPL